MKTLNWKFRSRSIKLDSSAFTLIEMLGVVAIIALITAAVAPMVFGTLVATKLSSAGQTMSAAISLGHELAVAESHDVEVRFYSYTEADEPGSKGAYRAIILVNPPSTLTGDGIQMGEIIRLPSGIIIGDSSTLSPLLSSTSITSSSDKEKFIRSSTAKYKAFRFRPDGTTSLASVEANKCYFTLGEERLLSDESRVPANFYAIQSDPLSGRASSYRP